MSEQQKPIKHIDDSRFYYEVVGMPKNKKRWTTLNKTTSYSLAIKTVELKSRENYYSEIQINRIEKLKSFKLNRKVKNEQTIS